MYFSRLGEENQKSFVDIATELLKARDYEPYACSSENEAKTEFEKLIKRRKWSCCFIKSDTCGEKEFEEFYNSDEILDNQRFSNISIVKIREVNRNNILLNNFVNFAVNSKKNRSIEKSDYVKEFRKILPYFNHIETGRNLDQKM